MQNLNLEEGTDQVQGYKDCLSCLIPAPTKVGGKENIWFDFKILNFRAYFAWKDFEKDKNCLH